MIKFEEYRQYDAIGLADLVRSRQVAPVELLNTALARMEQVNGRLNAVVLNMADIARRHLAANPDQAAPLAGVPFLLKDLTLHYKGARLTNGSAFFRTHVSDHDSELTARYRNAGLTIFGRSASPEFGTSSGTESAIFGITRNPWNTNCSPGGSSGGSASAIAAGIVPTAQAGDAGGSIRIPASCCGLFGLKPTRGRVTTGPDTGEGLGGVSCAHVITRSVRDSALILDLTGQRDEGAPYHAPPPSAPFLDAAGHAPKPLRIGLQRLAYNGMTPDKTCIDALEDAAALCESLGHTVEEVDLAVDYQLMEMIYAIIFPTQLLITLKKREIQLGRPLREGDIEPANVAYIEQARNLSAQDYAEAVLHMHQFGRAFCSNFQHFDVLLSPTLGVTPPRTEHLSPLDVDTNEYKRNYILTTIYNEPANLSGCPSMSVPLYWSEDGLPVGSLFTARYGEEETLFALAAQLEAARPWFDRHPPEAA